MPSWGEIAREIGEVNPTQTPGASPFDVVRRRYLTTMHGLTGRATILYETKWTIPSGGAGAPLDMLSITQNDIHGFMEAVHGLTEPELDLILHSPGGSGEAAEAIVLYLRSKFSHIRVFVPHMAMSAATMLACAADQIVMGKHSFIGPIDPQLQLQTALGPRFVAAQAIIQQFEMAKAGAADPAAVRAWIPMLSQYGPDLLATCTNASELSKSLVTEWLTEYMFNGDPSGVTKAAEIGGWLADHSHFKTHGRPISRKEARQRGLAILDLESDQALQDAVLSLHHATAHTFTSTGAVKIIENHLGKAYLQVAQSVMIGMPPQIMPFPMPTPPTSP
jgi:hypothetical protein